MQSEDREMDMPSWFQAWNFWPSILGAQAAYNNGLHEIFLVLSSEWQTFIRRRMSQNIELAQHVAKARTPEQLWAITTRFWQKAAEDYTLEYVALATLAGNRAVSLADEARHAGAEATRLQKAA